MEDGVIFNKNAAGRIKKATKFYEQSYINPGLRDEKIVRRRGGCTSRNEIWKLKITGTPTGGSFDIDVTVNNVTETITIDYNDTAADVKTQLATHSELASTDLDTSGGPFPGAEILVEFIDTVARKRMFNAADNAPIIDDSGLTGGASPAAWLIPYQPGSAGNANP